MNNEENKNIIRDFYSTVGVKGMDEMTEIDHRLYWELPLIENAFAPKSTLLDVGSGQGRIALRLARKGYGIVGIDLIPEFVEYTNEVAKQEHLNASFICDDFMNLDKHPMQVQGAYCMWGTIRHILTFEDQVKLMGMVYGALEKNSRFLIDTIDEENLIYAPNIDNEFQCREVFAQGDDVYAKVTHKKLGKYTIAYCFTESKLRKIFSEAGFVDIERVQVPADRSRLVIIGRK